MTFRPTNDIAPAPSDGVGVMIAVTDPAAPAMHVGIIFEADDGQARLLHLAMHQQVRCDPLPNPEDGYFWADCSWLADPRRVGSRDHLLDVLQTIAELKEIVDYGWNTPDDLYGGDGRLLKIPVSKGATCATFAALAFKAAGLPVVDLRSWQSRPGDTLGQRRVLDHIQRRYPDRYEVIKDQPVRYRLFPHEFAAAAAREVIPTQFDQVDGIAAQLYNLLLPPSPESERIEGGGALAD